MKGQVVKPSTRCRDGDLKCHGCGAPSSTGTSLSSRQAAADRSAPLQLGRGFEKKSQADAELRKVVAKVSASATSTAASSPSPAFLTDEWLPPSG